MKEQKLYVAVNGGIVLTGAKGQAAFLSPGTMSRSLAQTGRLKGTYDVLEFTLADILEAQKLKKVWTTEDSI